MFQGNALLANGMLVFQYFLYADKPEEVLSPVKKNRFRSNVVSKSNDKKTKKNKQVASRSYNWDEYLNLKVLLKGLEYIAKFVGYMLVFALLCGV